jgi:hypothetical protein
MTAGKREEGSGKREATAVGRTGPANVSNESYARGVKYLTDARNN